MGKLWRSGLEEAIGDQLNLLQVDWDYEEVVIPFIQPVKARKYTPDYLLNKLGIIIEAKGKFVQSDRQKHLLVKAQYPDLDIRFVFSNSRIKIAKNSKTTYAKWAQKYGYQYADKLIPRAWLEEKPNLASLNAIKALG